MLPETLQEYGARPLRRAVTHLVDDALSDAILSGALTAGATARMDADADGRVTVTAVRPGDDEPVLRSEIVALPGLLKKVDVVVGA